MIFLFEREKAKDKFLKKVIEEIEKELWCDENRNSFNQTVPLDEESSDLN